MFKHIPRYHLPSTPCLLLEFRPASARGILQHWPRILNNNLRLFHCAFFHTTAVASDKKKAEISYDFEIQSNTISDILRPWLYFSFCFLTTNSVFWLICVLEQFGFGYVAGTPVTVGVTMYVLSISSVSEVMMVLKTYVF